MNGEDFSSKINTKQSFRQTRTVRSVTINQTAVENPELCRQPVIVSTG